MDYATTLPWNDEATETLVIHCGDHRFQAHIDEFVREGLKRKSFDRLALPGGPQFLIAGSYLPKFEWAGRRWAKYLAKQHGIREIICLAHENCGWYRNITVGNVTLPLLKERQISDLKKAREVLQGMFGGIKVELYYVQPSEKKNVEFVTID